MSARSPSAIRFQYVIIAVGIVLKNILPVKFHSGVWLNFVRAFGPFSFGYLACPCSGVLMCYNRASCVLRTIISFVDGQPRISWKPRIEADKEAKRVYTIYGREKVEEGGWTTPTNALHRFFRVGVEMR